jgi:hypothetical protein
VNGGAADPDAEFAKLYAADPVVVGGDDWLGLDRPQRTWLGYGTLSVAMVVATLTGFVWASLRLARWLRRRAEKSAPRRPV